jgi:hypothetical protein
MRGRRSPVDCPPDRWVRLGRWLGPCGSPGGSWAQTVPVLRLLTFYEDSYFSTFRHSHIRPFLKFYCRQSWPGFHMFISS